MGSKSQSVLADRLCGVLDGSTNDPRSDLPLAEALGRFLSQLVQGAEGWSPYWWIDGAQLDRVVVADGSSVLLTGLSLPSDERNQWLQPFRAMIHVDTTHHSVVSYDVQLADATFAINAVAYDSKPPRLWPAVDAWRFHFEGGVPPAHHMTSTDAD